MRGGRRIGAVSGAVKEAGGPSPVQATQSLGSAAADRTGTRLSIARFYCADVQCADEIEMVGKLAASSAHGQHRYDPSDRQIFFHNFRFEFDAHARPL